MLKGYKIAAVCASRIYEDVINEFIASLCETLAPQGWRVLIFQTGSDLYQKTKSSIGDASIFELMDPAVVDAVILFGDKLLDERVIDRICSRVQPHGIPVVMLNIVRKGCSNITFDFEKGFAEVVRHLAAVHGITDYHMIAGLRGNSFSDNRIDVMRRVLGEYGIPFGPEQVSYGDFWSAPAREAVRKLIEENRLPQAIVCANDNMAIACCAELAVHGYKVPQDVIVTGFDGIEAINYSFPKITSAKCDYAELGRTAADLVVRADAGETIPEETKLVPQLILQESCGCAPRQSLDVTDYINNASDSFTRFRNEDEKLTEISAAILTAPDLETLSQQMQQKIFYCMIVMLKRECIDPVLDPLQMHSATTFGEELYVAFDSDCPEEGNRFLPRTELVPRLEYLLAPGKPLIFSALHQVDIPLGYICFHYQSYDHSNFLKINQITMSLSAAFAGLRNLRYQEHLHLVMEEMYQYDSLTGMFNRNAFLRHTQALTELPHDPVTLVLCDLDGLKYINDHFSHQEGDNAITIAGAALHEACPQGFCCRYGGDEFVALLAGERDHAAIREAITHFLGQYNEHSRKPYAVSVSIGIVTSADETFDGMFERADLLMYQDKLTKPHRRH
ncbi:MAG: GGDEF domain-containing protein [Oscillospiraceae bacterium]|nr:GGDEF domain-containing protein [Oscillospiraceae bacterium]